MGYGTIIDILKLNTFVDTLKINYGPECLILSEILYQTNDWGSSLCAVCFVSLSSFLFFFFFFFLFVFFFFFFMILLLLILLLLLVILLLVLMMLLLLLFRTLKFYSSFALFFCDSGAVPGPHQLRMKTFCFVCKGYSRSS